MRAIWNRVVFSFVLILSALLPSCKQQKTTSSAYQEIHCRILRGSLDQIASNRAEMLDSSSQIGHFVKLLTTNKDKMMAMTYIARLGGRTMAFCTAVADARWATNTLIGHLSAAGFSAPGVPWTRDQYNKFRRHCRSLRITSGWTARHDKQIADLKATAKTHRQQEKLIRDSCDPGD